MPKTAKSTVPSRPIEHHIHIIGGQKVMLDSELAALYGVSTGALNQAVRRNLDRFPEDFMFTLNRKEAENLKSQTGGVASGREAMIREFPLPLLCLLDLREDR